MNTSAHDTDLSPLLRTGDQDDIAILIDFLTDNGKGRISMNRDVCALLVTARDAVTVGRVAQDAIVSELQRFGGNSLLNMLRGGKGVSYREIVRDVADHLDVECPKGQDIAGIESAILMQMVAKSLEKMSDDEKQRFFAQFRMVYDGAIAGATLAALARLVAGGGAASYQLALVAANAVARALAGRGVTLGTNAVVARGIGAFAGPIGWALTAIWTAYDLASPAYRVTVPCVVQIAYMRQKAMLPHLQRDAF
ncbi:uncharacterized protein YaaW (UPF0174 family) [Janthinobacterium sp. 35]|uniref:YaaW family protein n=1 Tax=Janthinobacterium sp. 35 TaxID=2035210 RepID=UPI000C1889BD|nr:ubiquinol-cytochrome C chaperone family protein [Janthinobacterium sp. 35]PIG25516.1 uncharacterized protein YaaW (UPF0174 family) [Janthinobacterium sp. 35]